MFRVVLLARKEEAMLHARRNRTRRAAACTALAALLGLLSLTLTQCTTAGDGLTGVTLDRSVPTSCVRQCQDLYAALFDLEQKRHATEVESCLAIDVDQLKKDCLQAESARHSVAMDHLAADKVDCLDNCNRPGSGSAG